MGIISEVINYREPGISICNVQQPIKNRHCSCKPRGFEGSEECHSCAIRSEVIHRYIVWSVIGAGCSDSCKCRAGAVGDKLNPSAACGVILANESGHLRIGKIKNIEP